jgi:hypothetical protein
VLRNAATPREELSDEDAYNSASSNLAGEIAVLRNRVARNNIAMQELLDSIDVE